MTDDLIAFIRARVDEDEALALEAPAGPWHVGNAVDPTQPCHVHTVPGARMVADGLNWLAAEHIARHHPARILAAVQAKRDMLAHYERVKAICDAREHADYALAEGAVRASICHMATQWADHPNYLEMWTP